MDVIPDLESIGERLYNTRARFMVDTDQGLTKTYNALKDPACDDPRILELRRLHEEMDRAVLAAYGWSDIAVPPYCPLTDSDREALQAFEDEVIDRLYVLNAERAREEQRLGLAGKKRGRAATDGGGADDGAPEEAPAPKKTGKGKKAAATQGKLFCAEPARVPRDLERTRRVRLSWAPRDRCTPAACARSTRSCWRSSSSKQIALKAVPERRRTLPG